MAGGKITPSGESPFTAARSKYFLKPHIPENFPYLLPLFYQMAEGRYIVTLKEDASTEIVDKVKSQVTLLGGQVVDEFSLIKGFLAKLPPVHIDSLKSHDGVANIEEDKEVHIQK